MKKLLYACIGAALAIIWVITIHVISALGYLSPAAEVPATAAGVALLLAAAFYA